MTFKRAALGLTGLLVAIQFVPIRRDNPPVTSPVQAPAAVRAILDRACADCHSHNTVWPWYSRVAPASWLVARDVHEGRRFLNLSEWASYSTAERWKKLALLSTIVQRGDMPPWFYTPLHPAARLSDEDISTLVMWADNGGEN